MGLSEYDFQLEVACRVAINSEYTGTPYLTENRPIWHALAGGRLYRPTSTESMPTTPITQSQRDYLRTVVIPKRLYEYSYLPICATIIEKFRLEKILNNDVNLEFGFNMKRIHKMIPGRFTYCEECHPDLKSELGFQWGNLGQYLNPKSGSKRKSRNFMPKLLVKTLDLLEGILLAFNEYECILMEYIDEFEHICLSMVFGTTDSKLKKTYKETVAIYEEIYGSQTHLEGTLSDLPSQ